MLKPISEKHSINRVIANIFVPQLILKPKDVFDKLLEKQALKSYQKKGLTSSKTIAIKQSSFNVTENQHSGFILEEFDNRGRSVNILKVENDYNTNRLVISFENRQYDRWAAYIGRIKSELNELSEFLDLYIDAIGLTYIDEFIWDSNDKIIIESVFNKESDYLNKKFLNAYNGTLVFVSQSDGVDNNYKEEKTEILFNNIIKRIIINHTSIVKHKDIQLLKDCEMQFDLNFENSHASSKQILRDILTIEIQKSIGLL